MRKRRRARVGPPHGRISERMHTNGYGAPSRVSDEGRPSPAPRPLYQLLALSAVAVWWRSLLLAEPVADHSHTVAAIIGRPGGARHYRSRPRAKLQAISAA